MYNSSNMIVVYITNILNNIMLDHDVSSVLHRAFERLTFFRLSLYRAQDSLI